MLKNMQEILESGFQVLNEVYFQGELPPIVISIMSSPRSNGHFTCGKVWRSEEVRMHEINISAEHLDRPIENIMATMCHEMVHYYCSIHHIAETSQDGRYHNKTFKKEAEQRGLKISQGSYIGWSITEPTEAFKKIIQEHGLEKPININRDGFLRNIDPSGSVDTGSGTDNTGAVPGIQRRKSSTRKYICPICKTNFRATKEIRVLCMECNQIFIRADE